MCDGSVSASVFFWHLCKLESKISRVPSADGTGPVPADPQAGVRALDLARTLLRNGDWATRAEHRDQPLQALDAERREQWLWNAGRWANRTLGRGRTRRRCWNRPTFRSRAMRTTCGWMRSGKSTSVGLTVSGVSARVEGRGADSFAFWGRPSLGGWCAWVLSCCFDTKLHRNN